MAIKLIDGINKTSYTARKVLREVHILTQLSLKDSNIFTSKILDLIVPNLGVEGADLNHLFIVMPLGRMDLKTFLASSAAGSMTESHLITFLYNMLCSMNHIHSRNIIHRDIKPANILIDE